MSATSVTVVATIWAKRGQEEPLKKALQALIAPTRAEPGCLHYDLHRAVENPALFLFHENWQSKADLDAHLQKPHLRAFMATAGDLLAEPPTITLWERVE